MSRYYSSYSDAERMMKRLQKKYEREREYEKELELHKDQASVLVELAEIRFKNNVPLLEQEPSIEQYDMPPNAKELIESEKKTIEDRKKRKNKIIEIITWIISISIGAFIIYKLVFTYGFLLAGLGAFVVGAIAYGVTTILFVIIFPDKKIDIQFEDQYKKYEEDTLAYNYWQAKKSIQYWDSLDGHAFERNVASLYRKHGFDAQVSKEGGDGGIDIILIKGDERIAVQCKAHNKAVAPAVARDLYGTMVDGGFEKGIIVSKNGFTKGVFSFVRDKNIELVDLDDIIAMAKAVQ